MAAYLPSTPRFTRPSRLYSGPWSGIKFPITGRAHQSLTVLKGPAEGERRKVGEGGRRRPGFGPPRTGHGEHPATISVLTRAGSCEWAAAKPRARPRARIFTENAAPERQGLTSGPCL